MTVYNTTYDTVDYNASYVEKFHDSCRKKCTDDSNYILINNHSYIKIKIDHVNTN